MKFTLAERKKLPKAFLDEKFVDYIFKGIQKIIEDQTKRYSTKKKGKTVSVDADKALNMVLKSIIKLKNDKNDDFQVLADLIEITFRQNIEQQKQIDRINDMLGKSKITDKERSKLRDDIRRGKKSQNITELEQVKLLRFVKRQYDDEVRNTSLD